jgi:hypothetical protein
VSGQRLWGGLGGGPVLRRMSVRVRERQNEAHSQSAERWIPERLVLVEER